MQVKTTSGDTSTRAYWLIGYLLEGDSRDFRQGSIASLTIRIHLTVNPSLATAYFGVSLNPFT